MMEHAHSCFGFLLVCFLNLPQGGKNAVSAKELYGADRNSNLLPEDNPADASLNYYHVNMPKYGYKPSFHLMLALLAARVLCTQPVN